MRLEQLTFTRFLAAISIVVFHYGRDVFPFDSQHVQFLVQSASSGVSYFFILSGFIMIIAYNDKGVIKFGNYLKKRIARIYPVYFLAVVIMLLFYISIGAPINYTMLILNITLTQSWVPGYALSFNSPGWSLAVEMFFYILFPFLFNHVYRKIKLNQVIIPIFIVFVCSQILMHVLRYSSFYDGYPSKGHDFIFYFPLMHLSEFLIGNLASLLFLRGVKVKNYDLPILGLILIGGLLFKFNFGIIFHNGMFAFVFVPIIILISANNGLLTRVTKSKVLVFLGEISYGIYILQAPIYSWGNKIMKSMSISNNIFVFYCNLLVLIGLSAVSYKFFEAPLRRFINNLR